MFLMLFFFFWNKIIFITSFNNILYACVKISSYTYIDENETDKLCRVPPYDIIHVAKLVHSVVKYVKRIELYVYSVHIF